MMSVFILQNIHTVPTSKVGYKTPKPAAFSVITISKRAKQTTYTYAQYKNNLFYYIL